MPTRHQVVQGDCISSLAFQYGFFPDTIWNHPDNADLKQKRQDPNVLMPGDVVVIPDKDPKTVSKSTDQRHRFQRRGVPEYLSLRFLIQDEPRAHEPYTLNIDGVLSTGQLDGNGCCLVPIPPNAKQGTLTLGDPASGEVYQLNLGHLDPVEEETGVRARLHNLGYLEPQPDQATTEQLATAIKRFQSDHGLSTDQGLDDETRQLLKKEHGA